MYLAKDRKRDFFLMGLPGTMDSRETADSLISSHIHLCITEFALILYL